MNQDNHLGRLLKQQRISLPLTLQELAAKSRVSASHLGRIERGERFPSAHILQKIARPLAFEEDELFSIAGYLSPRAPKETTEPAGRLDPYVSIVLSEEPIETQRVLIGILAILKSIAKAMT
ncbi:MAG: helix-turn-helix transcriptional regulator [Patescibacteria group bacterium]